jgi:hypothetical protein
MDRRYRRITGKPQGTEAVRVVIMEGLSRGYREVRCARAKGASLWHAYALPKK